MELQFTDGSILKLLKRIDNAPLNGHPKTANVPEPMPVDTTQNLSTVKLTVLPIPTCVAFKNKIPLSMSY